MSFVDMQNATKKSYMSPQVAGQEYAIQCLAI
jgi:hypothetical protein